jgi:DNA-binding NarL/FixJ family response regulator
METTRSAILADDHPLWLAATANLVERMGVEVAARTVPGADALRAVHEMRPDLFVTDLPLADETVARGKYVGEAHALSRETKIIVLSASEDLTVIQRALVGGASAYVLKRARAEDLAAAIRLAFEHSVFLAMEFPLWDLARRTRPAVESNPKLDELTPRELETLRLVADGLTNAELARMLWVSQQTVKFHLSNIYRKLGVTNRTEASRWAQVNGLLGGEPQPEESAAVAS